MNKLIEELEVVRKSIDKDMRYSGEYADACVDEKDKEHWLENWATLRDEVRTIEKTIQIIKRREELSIF